MADNSQKTPLARTLNQFAARTVLGAMEQLGRSLPASVVSRKGAIVTVKFLLTSPYTLPNVTVPLIGSEYVRLPIQAGCLGWVMTADAYLGGVSGLGGGTAGISPRGNLSMLVFSPIGNKNWTAADDDEAVVIYGPDGVILRDSKAAGKLQIKPTTVQWDLPAGVSLVINGNVVINGNETLTGGLALGGNISAQDGRSTYAGNFYTSGGIVAGIGTGDSVGLQTHTHTQPNDSHGDVEGATASPTGGT
jgi:hypothetical protein